MTLTALDHPTVSGSPLLLQCNVTMVSGINGSVDIVWMKDNAEIKRVNNIVGHPINNGTLLLHTSSYKIRQLQMNDNNAIYHCQAVINTSPLVNNSDEYIPNVTGK